MKYKDNTNWDYRDKRSLTKKTDWRNIFLLSLHITSVCVFVILLFPPWVTLWAPAPDARFIGLDDDDHLNYRIENREKKKGERGEKNNTFSSSSLKKKKKKNLFCVHLVGFPFVLFLFCYLKRVVVVALLCIAPNGPWGSRATVNREKRRRVRGCPLLPLHLVSVGVCQLLMWYLSLLPRRERWPRPSRAFAKEPTPPCGSKE
jgi:hypothetical protein